MDCKSYLQTHARRLDLRLHEHLFKGADGQAVVEELAAYQNTDGGFGRALEPDLRLPDSSVLATTVAFQYLSKIDAHADELASKAIHYLLDSYDSDIGGWLNIPPAAGTFPRAPWWDYKVQRTSAEWGNPSAEVLGYLLRYADQTIDSTLLQELSDRALRRLREIDEPEQHEVKCYIRLYQNADTKLRAQLHEPLAKHILQAAETDTSRWEGYVATPLSFIDSPDASFADAFDAQLLLRNAEHVRSQMVGGSHWEPTWEWGQFEDEWVKAKAEWSGKITVENLQLLHAFGLIG